MIHSITSSQNPYIKEIKSLKHKKYRDQTGKYLIEGFKIIEDALTVNADIESIIIDDNMKQTKEIQRICNAANNKNINIFSVSPKIISEISETVTPQGILGILLFKKLQIDKKKLHNMQTVCILENIQDPGNLGTIIRTADAAGIDSVVLLNGCVDLYNPKVIRSTMSSLFNVSIFPVDNLENLIKDLHDENYRIYATGLMSESFYYSKDFTGKTAFIFGNESKGLSDSIRNLSDEIIKIPVIGKINSLNVAQSAAVIFYEVIRQKFVAGKK